MKIEKIPFIFGILLSLFFFFFTKVYYEYRETPDDLKKPSVLLESFADLDLRYNDLKYKIAPYSNSKAPVALVSIDDDSLTEIGRWPWSRDLIAEMVDNIMKNDAASLAFDVIFSEPEKNNLQADENLGKIIEKYSDRIILGTFSENSIKNSRKFQDYCFNEAFKSTKGTELVKPNAILSIDDLDDVLEGYAWGDLLQPIFNNIKKSLEQSKLQNYGKTDVSDLHQFQKNALDLEQSKQLFEYCKSWLTKDDSYLFGNDLTKESKELVVNNYKSIFKDLNPKDIDDLVVKLDQKSLFNPIPQYGLWTPNIETLQTKALYTASFVANQDRDGYIRRYPLFYRSGNRLGLSYIPSLALQSYLLAKKYRAEVSVGKNDQGTEKKISSFNIFDSENVLKYQIPIDSSARTIIKYYGPQMSLPYIPAKEFFSNSETIKVYHRQIVNGKASTETAIEIVNKKEFLKGRSLIVGATAIGVYDLRTIPLEANYPGPEVHLTMLANLFDETFVKYFSAEAKIFPYLTLGIGILFSFIWSHLGAISSFVALNILISLLVAVDYYLFKSNQMVMSGILIIMLYLFTSNIFITFYKYFTEEKKKKQLKSTFSKYVSPAVVDELLKSDENLKLGGRRQRMSVFFSDVRGFTTISEKLAPEELSRVLNLYLTPMTEIVFKNSGTLDKYIGDAVMAFFGAPIFDKNHAAQACRCALESIVKLKELQKEFAAQNLPHIDIGIGINTGEMSVGNMGSNIVQNYTVMGDSVNLASRLEGITKEYGVRIVISETTYNDVKDQFIAREIDKVKVKGKNLPVSIFELICEKQNKSAKIHDLNEYRYLKYFEEAYQSYLKKDFTKAISSFNEVIKILPEDKVSKLYLHRCEDFLANPPEENWDGVFTMKTK